jgi:hypothetical protein
VAGISGAVDAEYSVAITVVKSGNESVLSKQVPEDWWQHEREAMAVEQRLSEEFSNAPGVLGIGSAKSEKTISGRKTSKITINLTRDNRANTVPIPDANINVIKRRPEQIHHTSCYNLGNFDPMPGGVAMGTSSGANSFTSGTLVSQDSAELMLTCAHPFLDDNGYKIYDTAYQNTQEMSDLYDHDPNQDWATVGSGPDVSSFDESIEESSAKVDGRVTESGLRDLMSNNDTVYRQGIASGTQSGTITEINQDRDNDVPGLKTDQVVLDMYVVRGDSGGPIYHQYSFNGCTYNAIVGIQSSAADPSGVYENCGDNFDTSYGGQAYSIHDSHSIDFDPRSDACY